MKSGIRSLHAIAAILASVLPMAIGTAAAESVSLAPGFEVDSDLLTAARQEGKVVYWCGLREAECQAAAAQYASMTGVTLEFVRLSTGPVLTRLTQERSAKIYSVDVIQQSEAGVWEKVLKPKKWIVPYVTAGSRKYPPGYLDKDGFYPTLFIIGSVIGYNTAKLATADLPTSFTDLTQAKYRGKIAMAHPKYSGGFAETVTALSQTLGSGYFGKVKAEDPLVISGSQYALNPILANGERLIALGAIESSFLEDKAAGKPVDVIYASEGTVAIKTGTAIVADAPHPNAAKLLQEYLNALPFQTLLASRYYLVPHPDAKYPAGRKPLSELKILPLSTEDAIAHGEEAKEAFSDLYGG